MDATERVQLGDVQAVVDYLTYCSYRYNRDSSPEVSPERWRPIFGAATDAMESRYHAERR